MLTAPIIPMEPLSHSHIFESKDHFFQVKWDGVRIIAWVEGKEIWLQNRKGHDRTQHYPELRSLPARLRGTEAVLDGEIVVLDSNGHPSFPRVLERDLVSRPHITTGVFPRWPITYIVFDILSWKGKLLTPQPLESRQEILQKALRVDKTSKWADKNETPDNIIIIENFANGPSLFAAVREHHLEGVVAKNKSSPYLPGKKTRHWLKIKNRRRQLCLVVGYLTRNQLLSSLVLAAYHGKQLLYLGRAGTGLTEKQRQELGQLLPHLQTKTSPWTRPPRFPGLQAHWIDPPIVVLIEFLEWTSDLKLRSPVIIGFPNQDPGKCQV
ncbi:MAG: hypothetical protein H5U02_03650 [Clostridia bacterium]|nr:hypothetical protein [Clostridia bacterium]